MTLPITTTEVTTPDGRILCVDSAGDPTGIPVLVHGGTPSSRLIPSTVLRDVEARGLHVLKYDRPGYGGSTPQPGRTVADCAADVRTIAEAFGHSRLLVWGYSGGGPHALASAALLPDLVVAAVEVAGPAPVDAEGLDYLAGMGESNAEDWQLYERDPEAARAKSRADWEQYLASTPEQMNEVMASLMSPVDVAYMTPERSAELRAEGRLGLADTDEGWWEDGVAESEPWGFDLADITIPVAVWHGTDDRFVPVQHGVWLGEHIPGADVHIVEGLGHPSLIDAKVADFHDWLLARW